MDLYQEVTNRIMEQLENGIIPWEKPWISAGNAVSHATGKPYSLLNQMLLGRPGEYVTFNQCQQEGGKVRKGEKSSIKYGIYTMVCSTRLRRIRRISFSIRE